MAISYPVDVANTRWALYRVSTQEIVRHNHRWPRADGRQIVNLDPDLVPLMEVDEPQPAYDPSTQTLQRSAPVVDVAANTHTHGWTVVSLSQEEIDAIAEREQAKQIYQALKAHTGSNEQRLTRLENVVAYLLKDQYGAQ